MSVQQRIRVIGGPWPERIGLEGVIVQDPGDGIYPFTRKRDQKEAVILLDDDPFDRGEQRSWSCVMSRLNFVHIGVTEGEK